MASVIPDVVPTGGFVGDLDMKGYSVVDASSLSTFRVDASEILCTSSMVCPTLRTTGNLGVGKAPAVALDVSGAANVSASITTQGAMSAGSASITNGLTAASASLSGALSAGSASITNGLTAGSVTAGLTTVSYDAIDGGKIAVPSLKNLTLTTGSNNAIQISGSGNVGIGKAPSVALDVNGQLSCTGATLTNDLNMSAGTGIQFYNPSNQRGSVYMSSGGTLTFDTASNALPIQIQGSQLQTLGAINAGGAVSAPSVSVASVGGMMSSAGLPASGGGTYLIAGGYTSPVSSRHVFGDGSNWRTHWSKRINSATTDVMTLYDSGNLDVTGNVGIGTAASSTFNLDVGGYTSGTTNAAIRVTTYGWGRGVQFHSSYPGASNGDHFISRGYGVSGLSNQLVIHGPNTTGGGINFMSSGEVSRMFINTLNGTVNVPGVFSAGSKFFKIPHPLPSKAATHYLVHNCIEGPQADLLYRGKVQLIDGSAVINIDEASGMSAGTFEALCRDVQCFTSNESDWIHVRGKVVGNVLTIEAQDPTATSTISWMVVGERKDKGMYETDMTDDNGHVIVEPPVEAKSVEPPAEAASSVAVE